MIADTWYGYKGQHRVLRDWHLWTIGFKIQSINGHGLIPRNIDDYMTLEKNQWVPRKICECKSNSSSLLKKTRKPIV